MDYFKILNLNREPFGNSPAPEFFFLSTEHVACLQQLELAVRLRRGLNVVMGDVGTGKTTLCRQLLLKFSESQDDSHEFLTHLILDPNFSTPREFLSTVAMTFGLISTDETQSEWHLKENIKNYLFQKGVDENKTVVLIIDEGQNIPFFGREILREFLNYETNENKLLQIVIFAQNEFGQILKNHANFADRVNQVYHLKPLNFRQTKALIRYRFSQAGRPVDMPDLFTPLGMLAIYRATGGYPRRIITLCHQILLTLIIQNKRRAGPAMIRTAHRRLLPDHTGMRRWAPAALFMVLALTLTAILLFLPKPLSITPQPPVIQPFGDRLPTTPSVASFELATVDGPTTPPADPSKETGESANASSGAKDGAAGPAKENPPGESTPAPPIPTHLGSLKIQGGGSVFLLLLQIYGNTESNRYKAVIKANPHIKDMNQVQVGARIAFPAIRAKAGSLTTASHWVQVAKKGSLEEAYRIFNTYPPDLPPIRMIPLWNKKEGLVFLIILRKGFNSEQEARDAIRELPAKFAADAEIMKKEDGDTVYFAY